MLINFNSQFKLRTNELNTIINYFSACYRDLFINQILYQGENGYNSDFYDGVHLKPLKRQIFSESKRTP